MSRDAACEFAQATGADPVLADEDTDSDAAYGLRSGARGEAEEIRAMNYCLDSRLDRPQRQTGSL